MGSTAREGSFSLALNFLGFILFYFIFLEFHVVGSGFALGIELMV